jgi:hypothetical protein
MEATHEVLKLLDHPNKSLCSHTNIILVKPRSLVDNGGLSASYLDDVDVRKSSGLSSNVNRESNRG